MEEFSRCSLCKNEFGDFVKLIVNCGSSLCEKCYRDLKEDADEAEGRFKCPACREEHMMPSDGLPDNKPLLMLIRSLPKKPMPESARELEKQVNELDAKIENLKAFDGAELVELRCQQLELEVQSGFVSAIDHLKRIEAKMLDKIGEYKSECLENLAARSTKPDKIDEELVKLTHEIASFSARWNKYYKRVEIYEAESDIEAARAQAAEFSLAIESTEKRLAEDAYGRKKVAFTFNTQFLQNWDHVGAVEIIEEKNETPQVGPPQAESFLSERSISPEMQDVPRWVREEVSIIKTQEDEEVVYQESRAVEIIEEKNETPQVGPPQGAASCLFDRPISPGKMEEHIILTNFTKNSYDQSEDDELSISFKDPPANHDPDIFLEDSDNDSELNIIIDSD